jgi:hypothetical protein
MNRSRKRPTWFLLPAALAAAAVAGATLHLTSAAGKSAESGRLTVTQGSFVPPGLYVSGDTLSGPKSKNAQLQRAAQKLAERASAPLIGADAPVAVPSPDGTLVAVNTWRWTKPIDWAASLADQGIGPGDPLGTPQLRVQDTTSGKDRPLEAGTMSAAWRSDGALAYVRGDQPVYRADTPYLRDVLVRAALSGAEERWSTKSDRFTVVAWAGSSLLVRRDVPGAPPDLVVFDAPGRMRTLAEGASFVALDPGGKTALVSVGPAETPNPGLRTIDVASGSTLGTVALGDIVDPIDNRHVEWATGRGSWTAGRAVVPTSTGLVVLDASDRLSVSQVLHLDGASKPNGALYEPRFTEDSTSQIFTWQDVPEDSTPRSVQLLCDRVALSCIRSTPVPSSEATRPVDDESRGSR